MATNLFAPMGLIYSRNKIGAAPTSQANQYLIKNGYGSTIGLGDLVKTGNSGSGSQGYVLLSTSADTAGLGVFAGVLPYYDQTAQQTMHGLNGAYPSSANPLADIPCLVISDPFVVFRAQVSGGPFLPNWRGQNINFVNPSNGAPFKTGMSTLALDGTSVATTATLPFRIEGLAGIAGGPQDPGNVNPWIEVSLNPGWVEMLGGTGV